MVWLPDSEKGLIDDTYSRFDGIPACDRQTDGRANGRTSCDDIVRATHSIVR